MFLTFEETAELILANKVLHIAGSEQLLRKLPIGNWVGGSTEYFMTTTGGVISDERLLVAAFDCSDFSIRTYDLATIKHIATNTFDDGFSIALLPVESPIHREFSANATFYNGMFIKALVGWVTGTNPDKPEQVPLVVNGKTGEIFTDKAVVLGIQTGKTTIINIVNIFEEDKNSPTITFKEFFDKGFLVEYCFVNGKKTVFADYLESHNIDAKLPLIGRFAGANLNTSIWSIQDGKVHFASPIFGDMEYRFAKPIPDYEAAFIEKLNGLTSEKPLFSVNCIGNFWHGRLEGKLSDAIAATFVGPVSFGEIAYQLVNQTLVYVTVK
ncbi:MAG: hypothetical protein FWG65_00970 [Turicibacter sp.]|nr:hypothetical protein [Turicibacter sp.]